MNQKTSLPYPDAQPIEQLRPPIHPPVRPLPHPYLRQLRNHPRHRWFSPLLVMLLAVVFYLFLMIALFIGFFVCTIFLSEAGSGDFDGIVESMADFNSVTGLVLGMLSVILMWPVVELATFCVYRRWFWPMISVGGMRGTESRGMRWGLLGRYILLSVPIWLLGVTTFTVLTAPWNGASIASPEVHWTGTQWSSHTAIMLAAVVLLVPFQAMAEEVVFRGLAMNVIGSWLRHPAWSVLIPVPFFVFGHLYDLPGLIDVGIFAVIMALLTLRTGGLEAAIAFHLVNNVFALAFGVLTGADLNATDTSPATLAVSLSCPLVFAGLVVLDQRRRDRLRTRAPK